MLEPDILKMAENMDSVPIGAPIGKVIWGIEWSCDVATCQLGNNQTMS